MKKQVIDLKLVHKYFSDLGKWLVIYMLVILVALLAIISTQSTSRKFILFLACISMIPIIMQIRYYILWVKAMKDICRGEIVEEEIFVNRIYSDTKYNFTNSGGAHIGDEHLIMEDVNGNQYRLCKEEWILIPDVQFAGVYVKIRFLKTSRIIISMKELPMNKKNRSDQNRAANFRKELDDYFKLNRKHR